MSLSKTDSPSAFTKMRQVYWEAKQSFNKSLGQREDTCIVSSDSELDVKIELLQTADDYFNVLMRVLLDYRDSLRDMVGAQEALGMTLIQYGSKDATAAGPVMRAAGRAIGEAGHRQSQLKTSLMYLFHEVETFQFKATADALQTVAKMEKVRRSYRSGLMWLKNESTSLDPDVHGKLRNFRKVQEHVKRLKVRFDGVKLECMQKIDLLLLSRSNLFSHSVVPYSKTFKKVAKCSATGLDSTMRNIPLCLSYNFVALKELNRYSDLLHKTLWVKQPLSPSESDGKCADLKTTEELANPPSVSKTSGKSTSNLEDTLVLIDLFEIKQEGGRTKTEGDNSVQHAASKYSDDLLSIKLDDYNSGNGARSFADKFGCSFLDPAMPQETAGSGDASDLPFWTLIQNAGQYSKLRNGAEATKDKTSIHQKPDSKWNDVLVQFDPFLDDEKMKSGNGSKTLLDFC